MSKQYTEQLDQPRYGSLLTCDYTVGARVRTPYGTGIVIRTERSLTNVPAEGSELLHIILDNEIKSITVTFEMVIGLVEC